MEAHIAFINRFCRLCQNESQTYKVAVFHKEINHVYKNEGIDINLDDPNCQSKVLCRSCYKMLKKCEEELKFKRKNPKSNKVFEYHVPVYKENVTVHKPKECECGGEEEAVGPGAAPDLQVPGPAGQQDEQQGQGTPTPSKVRRMGGDPIVSPSDKQSNREMRRNPRELKSVKFDLTKGEEDFETGDIVMQEACVGKVFTSQDSFHRTRISNIEVAKFYFCRVCGQFPKLAKVSNKCSHIYCKVCIENYKEKINSTKCPPAHTDDNEGDLEAEEVEDQCNIPSNITDIVDITGFLKEIHECINISCNKAHCDKTFTVMKIAEHEEKCKVRGSYSREKKSLATTRSKPLQKEAFKTIDTVLEWCEDHKISPCDFLFFALKRLISREAPELEDSVHHMFKVFLKEADLVTGMTPLEGLALKIDTDLSHVQYQKLRMNKSFGSQLPSLQRVNKEKEKLDPGNVSYKVLNRSTGEVIEVHEAIRKSGIIDVDDDLGNFSYGDLNINVHGCRATLHDTVAKLFEEKYPEIEEEIKKSPEYGAIVADQDRKVKLFVKVCFDGTSAPVKSSKGKIVQNFGLKFTVFLKVPAD